MSHSQLFCHTSKSCVVNFAFFAWNPFNLPRVVGWYHWNPQNRPNLQEHMGLYESKDSKSFMYKHWQSVHRDDKEKPKFKASVVRFHQKSLVRQLEEAVILWRLSRGPGPGDPPGPGIRIMNSKGMYNRCSIKRLVLEDSESKALNEFPRKENDMNEVKVQDADETKTKLPSMIDSNSTSNKHASKVKTSSKPSVQTTDKQTKKSAEVITHYFKTK